MTTMTMSERIDDTLLSTWLDGELDRGDRIDERVRVEQWLRDHPEDATRARQWSADALKA